MESETSSMNSRRKGCVGERQWRDVLRGFGYEARRGQQYSGSPDSPDVVCDSLPFHWEVKRVQNLNIEKALQQAVNDRRTSNFPAVAHRKNGDQWKVTMYAKDFFQLLKCYTDL